MSENKLENDFIDKLKAQGYTYLAEVNTIESLHQNFRRHIEKNNDIKLSKREFDNMLNEIITDDVFKNTERLHDKYTLKRDDNSTLNITLYNTREWCKNSFEIINQLTKKEGDLHQRYDVIILINGIPMVHVELKKYDVSASKAIEQIDNYKKAQRKVLHSSIMCFTQLYIVSNINTTYYFANNNSLSVNNNARFIPVFMWADDKNKKITNLLGDFSETFLEKCFLSKMIARYIVRLQTENKLMVLRPYQVYAVESIINHIKESSSNGYIWHTTGSGKTLTSFKCATILKEEEGIDKILFVVDRKDLDKQTRDEFNKFEEGCVEQTKNKQHLLEKLLDSKEKIIVTTLQKLTMLLKNNATSLSVLKNKKMIFIFDECHRSQFGSSNKLIRDTFNNIQMFGFTGTPIFSENSKKFITEDSQVRKKMETETIFDKCLHEYLISHAINDNNVLRFKVDYYGKKEGDNEHTKLSKKSIVDIILKEHKNVTGDKSFNAIFTTQSINDAIEYYKLFKEEQKDKDIEDKLNITAVFSPPPNFESPEREDCENEENDYEDKSTHKLKEIALKEIIDDYNSMFGTSFNLSFSFGNADNFSGYYDDISVRMKHHRDLRSEKKADKTIDILIVVDMFLTGFDSKFINTLYVDKKLEYHGLIQAFSRTNRIYNEAKPHGNIINFVDLKEKVDEAIRLFSSRESEVQNTVWLAGSFEEVRDKYATQVEILKEIFEKKNLEFAPYNIYNLEGDDKKEFYKEFYKLIKLHNIVPQYINDDTQSIKDIMTEDNFDGFKCVYNEARKDPYSKSKPDLTPENDPELDFPIELLSSDIIDWEYIQRLLVNCIRVSSTETTIKSSKELESLLKTVRGDYFYVDKAKLIEEFFEYCQSHRDEINGKTNDEIVAIMDSFENEKINADWKALSEEHNLNLEFLLETVEYYKIYGKFNEDLWHSVFNVKHQIMERIKYRKIVEPEMKKIIVKQMSSVQYKKDL